jgi:T-complex protein 1 subunit gamma
MIQLSRTQDEEVGDGTTSVIILGASGWVTRAPLLAVSLRAPDCQATEAHRPVHSAAGEILHMAEPFLEKNIHPTVIVRGFARALEDAIKVIDLLAFPIDTDNREQMMNVVNSCIGTKFTHRFGTLMAVRWHGCGWASAGRSPQQAR